MLASRLRWVASHARTLAVFEGTVAPSLTTRRIELAMVACFDGMVAGARIS
jgi:hypothetical protein